MIFIGSIYPESLKRELLEMGSHVDFAADTFQNALISGLSHFEKIDVITSPVLRMKKPHIKDYAPSTFSQANITNGIYVGTKNGFLKKFYELFQIRKQLRKKLAQSPKSNVVIYAVHSPFLLSLLFVGFPITKSCLIVPDLPEHMSSNASFLYRLAKKVDKLLINISLKKIDSYVLLSPFMKDKMSIGDKPWVQVEGLYQRNSHEKSFEKETSKTILYTGDISERYGVFDLIEAFTRIPHNDFRLWLCGGCNDMRRLQKYLDMDSRIIYFGLVDKQKIFEFQHKATLLVNPRHSNHEYTKYSFPSKTMEYLASGTPTVMCKLPAMPNDYLPHVFIFEDESVDGYAKKIESICSMPIEELSAFGAKASKFILQNKNEVIQAKKIIELLTRQ